MGLDPNGGVWVYQMLPAVNQRLNAMANQDLNRYHYGEAQSAEYITQADTAAPVSGYSGYILQTMPLGDSW